MDWRALHYVSVFGAVYSRSGAAVMAFKHRRLPAPSSAFCHHAALACGASSIGMQLQLSARPSLGLARGLCRSQRRRAKRRRLLLVAVSPLKYRQLRSALDVGCSRESCWVALLWLRFRCRGARRCGLRQGRALTQRCRPTRASVASFGAVSDRSPCCSVHRARAGG
jgi:hypothetical protein